MMKAIVKNQPSIGLTLEKRAIPQIGDHDVLIKIRKTAICGTDIHLYKWDEWAAKTLPLPSIIGHEFVGIVEKVGSKVSSISAGDKVCGDSHLTCGTCLECMTGKRVLCPNTHNIGVNGDGCFAEYLRLPEQNVFKMPDEIPDNIATICDPLGNAVHTALSTDLVGKDVLITGAGPIGLMAIAVVKKAGARHVVITDVNPYRLELAKKFYPSRIVDVSKENMGKIIQELNIERGFDVSLEMSGSPQAFTSLPDLTAPGGKIVLLGVFSSAQVSIDWHKVVFKMLSIQGIYGRKIFRTWFQTLHMLQSGLDISAVITHELPMEEFEKGFEIMLSGNSGKVILDWTNA